MSEAAAVPFGGADMQGAASAVQQVRAGMSVSACVRACVRACVHQADLIELWRLGGEAVEGALSK